MTKDSFLSKLNFCLLFKVNTKKRKIVMQDYKDFFADGLAGGESEDALCEKFGSPAEIAREVSEGEVNKSTLFSILTLALPVFMVLYLFSYDIFCITQVSYRYVIAVVSIITVFLCAKTANSVIKSREKTVAGFFIFALTAFIFWCLLSINIFKLNFNFINRGTILTYCDYICNIITAISLYVLMINIKNISKKFLVLLPCLFYMILSLCEMFVMMSNVSGPDNFVPLQSLLIPALFILPSLLLSLFFVLRKVKV